MVHKLKLVRPSDALPNDPRPYAMEVHVNDRLYGLLRYNGQAYFGNVPSNDGRLIEGAYGLLEWRRIIATINKDAAQLESMIRSDPRMHNIQAKVDEAKETMREFFDDAGILPGDVAELTARERDALMDKYGQWLENKGILPSF